MLKTVGAEGVTAVNALKVLSVFLKIHSVLHMDREGGKVQTHATEREKRSIKVKAGEMPVIDPTGKTVGQAIKTATKQLIRDEREKHPLLGLALIEVFIYSFMLTLIGLYLWFALVCFVMTG